MGPVAEGEMRRRIDTIEAAERHDVPIVDNESFDRAVIEKLDEWQPELLILAAGSRHTFMR